MSKLKYMLFSMLLLFSFNGEAVALQGHMISISGETQGTTYHIKYFESTNRNYQNAIDSLLLDFDKCLSLYRPDSELSLFNRSEKLEFKLPYFYPVLQKSREIFEATNGLYDPTILPLVEAYGFGPNQKHRISEFDLKETLMLIGYDHIQFDSIAVKKDQFGVRLDFNGIAQGYSVDIISMFLEQKGVKNYMVEIGGEIRCKGSKAGKNPWIAGIENPLHPNQLIATIPLQDRSMTTSGNYRNHFEVNGQRFNHIINPKNGSMEQSNILSVTVLAPDAFTADGYDTPFFLMGLDLIKEFVSNHPALDVFVVFTNKKGDIETYASAGIIDIINFKTIK